MEERSCPRRATARRESSRSRGPLATSRRLVLAGLGMALLSLLAPDAGAQVSPGPLAKAHEDLDDPLHCFDCHGMTKGSMHESCVACHKEIGWLEVRRLGLHGRERGEECSVCHPDHAGREFAMIQWKEGSADRFDHREAGWPLDGKHASVACRDCHKASYQVSEAATLIKRKDRAASWLGLDRACLTCHKDAHHGALGADCEKCHDTKAWKPASVFDHSKTAYPLTGKHAPVACEKCHLAPSLPMTFDETGRPEPLYKPLPHAECSDCHKDPHAGRLGPACARCHVTGSFKEIEEKTFNHDLTRYPLRGLHIAVKCSDCHDPRTAWGKKPPFASCTACHVDPHAAQATLAGRVADCEACHNVAGFRPSTYTIAQHESSTYPLVGRHRKVKCEACHLRKPAGVPLDRLGKAGVLLRPAHGRCTDCHGDAHGGQLAARPDRGACEPCHGLEGWKPSTYTAKEHASLKLPLEGKHARVECAACHGPGRKGLTPPASPQTLGTAKVSITLQEIECISCHFDPHEGRFAVGGPRPQKDGCRACHGLEVFRPSAVGVDLHRGFRYPLDGAHRATPCAGCHDEVKSQPAASSLILARGTTPTSLFTAKDLKCETCHQNPHGDQFARRPHGGTCEVCHDEDSFRPAGRFRHDRDAAFPLEGAHARIRCEACHPSRPDASGASMVIYRPVATECKSCHGEGAIQPLARTLARTLPAGAPPEDSRRHPASEPQESR